MFGPGKETDRATVEAKFAMAKHVDRVGRMADTLEFTNLELPRERFSAEVLEQLTREAPSTIEDGDVLVIRHCYVERRLVPLNIYLDRATPAELEAAVLDYGNAIRELAIANIFPGDMLWRNFGVTRHSRVALLRLRRDRIPHRRALPARSPRPRTRRPSSRPSRGTPSPARTSSPRSSPRSCSPTRGSTRPFRKHHADLLEPEFWQDCQRRIEAGEIVDFFPYPQSLRFHDR